jgi:hypothetical protein
MCDHCIAICLLFVSLAALLLEVIVEQCPAAGNLAVEIFRKHKHLYHNIAATMIGKDLKLGA